MTREDTSPMAVGTTSPARCSTPGAAGVAADSAAGDDSAAADSLIAHERCAGYRSRWTAVLGDFVDEPAPRSDAEADALVSEVLDQPAETFRTQGAALERQPIGSRSAVAVNESSIADLQLTLGRYRTFFDRLLSL